MMKLSKNEFGTAVMVSNWQTEYYNDYLKAIDIVVNFDESGAVVAPNPRSDLQLEMHWYITDEEMDKLFNGEFDEEEWQFLESEGYERYLEHYETVLKAL